MSSLEPPKVKKISELYRDGSPTKVLVTLFQDGSVTVCSNLGKDRCYTSEPNQEELFYIVQAFYTGKRMGFKIRRCE